MIHGYHVILPVYGFWLPNDPRGSWSESVRIWELLRFGPSTKSADRRSLAELTPAELRQRETARKSLTYRPVTLSEQQVLATARGFAAQVAKSGYTIWACSILPEHTHLIIARHSYKVEQIANLLKGAATSQVIKDNCHPLQCYATAGQRPPRMWAEHEWKVYLDSEEGIKTAVRYVEDNPVKEDRPAQKWDFVTPFAGIEKSGHIVYH